MYVYVVEGLRPVLLYVVPLTVVICVPFLKILYPTTAVLSELGLHERLICEVETAVAESPVGTVGAVVSVEDSVVAEAAVDCAELFPAAS